jgi:hypothetical protein
MGFYVIDHSPPDWRARPTTRFEESKAYTFADPPTCEECGGLLGPGCRWLGPYEAELEVDGTEFGDMAFASLAGVFVSDRFRSAWEAEGMTGLEGFEAVRIYRIRSSSRTRLKQKAPSYWYAYVGDSHTYVLDDESGVERETAVSCQTCRWADVRAYRRVVLDRSSWSGQDILIPRNLPTFIASQRFNDFVAANSLVGIWLVPADHYYRDGTTFRSYPE